MGKPCASASAHRKAQDKYVKKNPAAQRARVKSSEKRNASKVKARKAKSRKSGKSSGSKGRPRKC